ncbi:hypothetical protein D3C72_1911670 [compost metagenome]
MLVRKVERGGRLVEQQPAARAIGARMPELGQRPRQVNPRLLAARQRVEDARRQRRDVGQGHRLGHDRVLVAGRRATVWVAAERDDVLRREVEGDRAFLRHQGPAQCQRGHAVV